MTFPLSWPERLYGIVLMAYPRAFRAEYEDEMRRVFRDLLRDPTVRRSALFGFALRDLINGVARPEHRPSRDIAVKGALFGVLVVAFSIAARLLHPGGDVGFSFVPIPFIAFIPAAFWASRQRGSFADGIWVAVIMGAVSSTMVWWDWLLFGNFPFHNVTSFVLSMLIGTGLCIGPALIGATAGAATAQHNRSTRLG